MRLPQAECLSYSTISQVGMARLALRPPNTLSVPCHHTGINRDKPTETYFSSQNYPWCGRQRCVPAIKGKTPGSKPRDLSMSWAFSASCILEGYECQSPGNSSELPGYLDTSPLPSKKQYLLHGYARPCPFSDPPRQRYSARAQPWDLDSCVQTRSCRIGKVRPSAHVSRRGRSREEDICVEKYALVSTPATLLSTTMLDKDRGGSEGGRGMQQSVHG